MTISNLMARLMIGLAALLPLGCGTSSSEGQQATSTTPYGGTPHSIPGMIEAEHYDEGQPGSAYQDSDTTNHGVDYRGETHVDIEQRPDASNGHGIGWSKAGEWVVYTVRVEESGTYTIRFPVASDGAGGTFSLMMGDEDVTGPITIPDTGGWQNLEMIEKTEVQLEAGTYVMRLMMDTNGETGGVGDIDYMNFLRTGDA